MNPLELLRHHVSGAIERGEAQAIEAIPVINKAQRAMDFINASTDEGRTVYIATMTKAIAFSQKPLPNFWPLAIRPSNLRAIRPLYGARQTLR